MLGEHAGNADELVKCIEAHDDIMHQALAVPLLFLCGDKRLDTVPAWAGAHGVLLREVHVYSTEPADGVPVPAGVGAVAAVAVFSPSGASVAARDRARGEGIPWDTVRVLAIGRTTAAALEAFGFIVHGVADHPTADSLASLAACVLRAHV